MLRYIQAGQLHQYDLNPNIHVCLYGQGAFSIKRNMKGGHFRETPGTEKPFGSPHGGIIKTLRVRRRIKDIHCSSS
jgi:hypothetical protein